MVIPALASDISCRDHELVAPVLAPRRLVAPLGEGPLLTERHDSEPGGIEPQARQVLLGRSRSAEPQSLVVLQRAPFVAVPLDRQTNVGVRPERFGFALKDGRGLVGDRGEVEVEVDARCERLQGPRALDLRGC